MHWAQVGEAGFLWGIRFLHWVYRHGGIVLFRALLYVVMPWFFLSSGIARRASLEYLTRLYETSGGATPAPVWRNSFRHFMSFGETILEKLIAADVREEIREPFSSEGLDAFHRMVDEGRGVLVITAHFGNLMLLRRLGRNHRAHVRLTLLAHTRHAVRFHRIVRSLNPALEIDTIQVDSVDVATAMLLSERIAAGGIVVITGDRIPVAPSNATMASSFLGRDAHFPVGPYILGAALACPVFMMFSARRREGVSVMVRRLADRIVLPRRERRTAIRPYLDAYADALAGACAEHPLQWFNFYPFWRDHAEKPTKPLA
ncbi:MAG: acyltransferase [Azoarcus sp.]|jgi:predicted LPLAT superfamily acyltransferase|nr:acyltransferase [Azoarcus sp.]